MSIHVTDFKWEKGKNDLQYIELLEKTLKNEQAIAKIRELSKENKEIRNKAIDEFLHKAEVKITDMILRHQGRIDFASGLAVANRMLDEIAEQMKGGE